MGSTASRRGPIAGRRRETILLIALVLLAGFPPAGVQAYPDRPVRMIVAYPPGGTGDLVGRVVAEGLSARLGVPVVVENQGGAGGAIAARAVARAAPDGQTILLAGNAIFAILPHLGGVGYDPLRDFTAVANISESQRLLAVRPTLPVRTLADLVAYAKARPGALNYGSAGIGSTLHVMTAMWLREAGVSAVHIPFRGSAPAVQALLAGDVDVMIDTAVIQHVTAGRLRGLAAVGDRRLPELPDVPTLAELGYPGVRTSGWQALLGPANLPTAIAGVLGGHVEAMLRDAAVLERLSRIGVVPNYRDAARLEADLREDHHRFGDVIRDNGITAE